MFVFVWDDDELLIFYKLVKKIDHWLFVVELSSCMKLSYKTTGHKFNLTKSKEQIKLKMGKIKLYIYF